MTRTGRWRINVLVAGSEQRRRQFALLPDGAWLLVDHGRGDDTVTCLSPGTEMAVAVNRGAWVLRGQAADIVLAGSGRPVATSAGEGVAIEAPRVHADAIVALIVPNVTPPAAPPELEVIEARPDLVECRVDGRAVRWRLASSRRGPRSGPAPTPASRSARARRAPSRLPGGGRRSGRVRSGSWSTSASRRRDAP